MHFFVEFVKSLVPPNWKTNSTGWTCGNCPVCVQNGESRPDSKRRGGFRFSNDEWGYHCFNCGFKTRWSVGHRLTEHIKLLLKGFGCTESNIQRVSLELIREAETAELLNPVPSLPELYVPDWETMSTPNGAKYIDKIKSDDITEKLEAGLSILDSRELTHWTDWMYSSDDLKMRNRMILPYRYQDRIVGYNARWIGTPPGGTPKYLVNKPPNFVFNLDRQHGNRECVLVVEGDYDAITTDGVALGSNSINEKQYSLIQQLEKRVILLPDFDQAGSELIEPALKYEWEVSFPPRAETCKDANQAAVHYGRSFVVKTAISCAISNPTKIRLLAKRMMS